jgi:hypothetical protein
VQYEKLLWPSLISISPVFLKKANVRITSVTLLSVKTFSHKNKEEGTKNGNISSDDYDDC